MTGRATQAREALGIGQALMEAIAENAA